MFYHFLVAGSLAYEAVAKGSITAPDQLIASYSAVHVFLFVAYLFGVIFKLGSKKTKKEAKKSE
jgi:hypothetical protein